MNYAGKNGSLKHFFFKSFGDNSKIAGCLKNGYVCINIQ